MYQAKKMIGRKGAGAGLPPRIAAMRELCLGIHRDLGLASELPSASPKRANLAAKKRKALAQLQSMFGNR